MDAENATLVDYKDDLDAFDVFFLALCTVITLLGALGNAFVIAAIIKTQVLRTVANLFVLSLAVTDFLVAIFILPLSVQYLYFKAWILGYVVCVLWVSGDVLLITASILSLVAISIDRYRAIKQPIRYSLRRTPALAAKIIFAVWVPSAIVAAPSVFVVDHPVDDIPQCGFKKNPIFTLCSSFVSFYGPLTAVLFVYVNIYRAAKARANRVNGMTSTVDSLEVAPPRLQRRSTLQRLKITFSRANIFMNQQVSEVASSKSAAANIYGVSSAIIQTSRISVARERKASRTIAVVVGVFVACWSPFFTVHVTLSLCHTCRISERLYVIITWIGYWNSALNPILYTLFNKDFRQAFWKLIRCKN